MTEQNKVTNVQSKKTPLILILSIVGLLSLGLGWGVGTFFDKTGLSSKSPVENALWAEFIATPWKTPDGSAIDTSHWVGKTVVLNFWGSWCPPCVEEMPMLARVSDELKSQNVIFVGIGIDSPSNIREFLKKMPIPYTIAIGGLDGSNWAKRLGNEAGGLPFTVIIGPNGLSKMTKLGKISEEEIKSSIKNTK
jgi:thiol-disulfide isomerase/thioredoxin